MKSLWHGYNVANFVIKFRVHNTRLSNSVLEGDRLMFSFLEYYFNIKMEICISFSHNRWQSIWVMDSYYARKSLKRY